MVRSQRRQTVFTENVVESLSIAKTNEVKENHQTEK